jgi:hypothetical protein
MKASSWATRQYFRRLAVAERRAVAAERQLAELEALLAADPDAASVAVTAKGRSAPGLGLHRLPACRP